MAADTDDDDDRPPWSMLVWMGLVCGVALGAVVVLLLRERRNQAQLGGSPINIWNVGGGTQYPHQLMQEGMQGLMLPQPASPAWSPPDAGFKTKTGTVTVSDRSSQRLVRASGGRPWNVEVRVIGPPGAYGILGTDPDSGDGAETGPNSFVIPAGGRQTVNLDPGDYLFARGSISGTVISYTARQLA